MKQFYKNLLLVLLVSTLTYSSLSFGQTNLVPNPSFEIYDTCPTGISQIINSQGWQAFRNTPDYYNRCASFGWVSVPGNLSGYQEPASGDAYSGIYTRSGGFREHLGCPLATSLIIGTKYYVSFKVSLVDTRTCASNKIGALFTTNSPNPSQVNNFAHVYSDSIITDTTSWALIFGSFTADSAYQNVLIGNFFDDLNTDSVYYSSGDFAYYFVDDVCVSTDSLYAILWTTASHSNDVNTLKIYPVPIVDDFTIELESVQQDNLLFVLYDVLGQPVFSTNFESNSIKLKKENLKAGLYFYHLKSKSQIITSGKITIN